MFIYHHLFPPSSCLRSQENLSGVGPKIEMVAVAPKMEIVNVVSATKIEMVNVGTKIEIQPQTQAIPPPQLQPHQPIVQPIHPPQQQQLQQQQQQQQQQHPPPLTQQLPPPPQQPPQPQLLHHPQPPQHHLQPQFITAEQVAQLAQHVILTTTPDGQTITQTITSL